MPKQIELKKSVDVFFQEMFTYLHKPQNCGKDLVRLHRLFLNNRFYLAPEFSGNENPVYLVYLQRKFKTGSIKFLANRFKMSKEEIAPYINFTTKEGIDTVKEEACAAMGLERAYVTMEDLGVLHALTKELLTYSSYKEKPEQWGPFFHQDFNKQVEQIQLIFRSSFFNPMFAKHFPSIITVGAAPAKQLFQILDVLQTAFQRSMEKQIVAFDDAVGQVNKWSPEMMNNLLGLFNVFLKFMESPTQKGLLKLACCIASVEDFIAVSEEVEKDMDDLIVKTKFFIEKVQSVNKLFSPLGERLQVAILPEFSWQFKDLDLLLASFEDHKSKERINQASFSTIRQELQDALKICQAAYRNIQHNKKLAKQAERAKHTKKQGEIASSGVSFTFFEQPQESTTVSAHKAAKAMLARYEERARKQAERTEGGDEDELSIAESSTTHCQLFIEENLVELSYASGAEEANTMFTYQMFGNIFFTCVAPKKIQVENQDYLQVLQQEGGRRLLTQDGLNQQGIKQYSSDWFSVKLRQNENRLICVRIENEQGLSVFVPYTLLDHKEYQKLILESKNDSPFAENFVLGARNELKLDPQELQLRLNPC